MITEARPLPVSAILPDFQQSSETNEKIITTATLNAEGNKIYVVENKFDLEDDESIHEHVVSHALQTMKEQQLDTTVILRSSGREDADYDMAVLEKDGSFSNMCGNGVRAVAKFAYDRYGVDTIRIQTTSGDIVHGVANTDGTFTAKLSPVVKLAESSETFAQLDLISSSLQETPDPMSALQSAASLHGLPANILTVAHTAGEPHMLVEHPEELSLEELRYVSERLMQLTDSAGYPFFPNGININYFSSSDGERFLLTYERGVNDFTGSCGTGAVCSADYIMQQNDERNVTFTTKGGTITVEYDGQQHAVTGNVEPLS